MDGDDGADEYLVLACPECESSQIYSRQSVSPRYRCAECHAEFDTPTERDYRDIGG